MPAEYLEAPEDEFIVSVPLAVDTNSFILLICILMLIGTLGIGLVGAAKTTNESRLNPILRTGAIIAIAGISTTFWGFNLSYPGQSNLIFSFTNSFGLPEDMPPDEYGVGGMSIWTDLLFNSCYFAFLGALIISATAARQTTISACLVALPVICISAPIVVSWKWGAGWLDMTIQSYDFAGAALFHWHAGVILLTTAVAIHLFKPKTQPIVSSKHLSLVYWLPGIILYSLVVISMNAGSTLTAQPDLVVAVVQVTLTAATTGMITMIVAGLFLKTRTLIEWAGLGFIAGCVSVSANADILDAPTALGLGGMAGLASAFTIFGIDRFMGTDPLGIVGTHGVAGALSTLMTNDPEFTSPFAQIILLVAVILPSIAIAAFITIIFGISKLLLVKPIPAGNDQ